MSYAQQVDEKPAHLPRINNLARMGKTSVRAFVANDPHNGKTKHSNHEHGAASFTNFKGKNIHGEFSGNHKSDNKNKETTALLCGEFGRAQVAQQVLSGNLPLDNPLNSIINNASAFVAGIFDIRIPTAEVETPRVENKPTFSL